MGLPPPLTEERTLLWAENDTPGVNFGPQNVPVATALYHRRQ